MDFVKTLTLHCSSNSRVNCIVLDLKTANRKVTDLETRIQRMEEERTEQNHGE